MRNSPPHYLSGKRIWQWSVVSFCAVVLYVAAPPLDDMARPAPSNLLRAEAVIRESIARLRKADDYGESGMDKTLADGVTITELPSSDPNAFTPWLRAGAARGRPEWIVADSTPRASRSRVLFLHGGGYAYYSPSEGYRPFTTRFAKAVQLPVLAIDYRKVPEHPFPAAVEDAVKALRWIWHNGPEGEAEAEHVFVVGDSAGGGLSLALLLASISGTVDGEVALDPLRLPTAAVGISAYTDLTCSLDSYRTRVWKQKDMSGDPVFSSGDAREDLKVSKDMGREYVGKGGRRWDNPMASPVFAEPAWLAKLPPVLLMVGDAEVMLDDSTEFHKRAVAAGASGQSLSVYPKMWHDWVLYADGCHQGTDVLAPALQGIEEAAQFIRNHATPA